ncbi:unnamed protein product [Closterium sp. Yama58-4]|nr:unnamed protein product [Closterium sp. Yama58-4]
MRSREVQQGKTIKENASEAAVSAWGSRLPGAKEELAPNDALTALLTAPSSSKFKTVSLYNHMGVGCQVNAHDAVSLADKQCLNDAVIDFHNILLNIRYPACPNGKSWVVLDSKAYAYAQMHGKPIGRCTGPSVFEYDYIAVPIFAGYYLEALVASGFVTVREYISFKGVSAKMYRRNMRADLCSHAEGTLIPELQRQGLRIPMQPVPIIDDDGYMCVDPPVDIRKELLDHKQKFAVLEHDIQVLTAKIEFLAISKGVTSDELDAGARQHLGAVAETVVPTATPRQQAARTPPPRALAAVPAISPFPAPRTPATKDGQVAAGEVTPAVVRHQERGQLALALRSRASTPVPAAPGNPGRAASSGRTGVMWNAVKQRYYVRIISARRQQVRLGSYEDKDEASYAYAAGAVVLRLNSCISCTVQLSDGERQALAGCTEESLRLLAPEARSRRKGRVSRVMHDVEEVEATKPAKEDQPMAEEPEEPEDPPEDYTDDEESVDDDAVYEPEGDDMEEEDDWEEVETTPAEGGRSKRKKNAPSWLADAYQLPERKKKGGGVQEPKRRKTSTVKSGKEVKEADVNEVVGAVDTEAASTPIVASAPPVEDDTEAVKERLIDELMEGDEEGDEEGHAGGQSSSNDPCGEDGSEEEHAPKVPTSRKRKEATGGHVTREEFEELRESQKDTAKTMARLESHVLTIISLGEGRKRKGASPGAAASLGREALKRKRQSDDDEESTCDEDELPAKVARHMTSDKSQVVQSALDILPAEKAWKVRLRIVCSGNLMGGYSTAIQMSSPYSTPPATIYSLSQDVCDLVKDHLCLEAPNEKMDFYPSRDAKNAGVCHVMSTIPPKTATLALDADKSRRQNLNKTLSEYKTGLAGRARGVFLPRMGLFRDDEDRASPWARKKERTGERARKRYGIPVTDDGASEPALCNWHISKEGLPFASGAFSACAIAAFGGKRSDKETTLKLYHMSWLEHLITDAIIN